MLFALIKIYVHVFVPKYSDKCQYVNNINGQQPMTPYDMTNIVVLTMTTTRV